MRTLNKIQFGQLLSGRVNKNLQEKNRSCTRDRFIQTLFLTSRTDGRTTSSKDTHSHAKLCSRRRFRPGKARRRGRRAASRELWIRIRHPRRGWTRSRPRRDCHVPRIRPSRCCRKREVSTRYKNPSACRREDEWRYSRFVELRFLPSLAKPPLRFYCRGTIAERCGLLGGELIRQSIVEQRETANLSGRDK